MIEFKGECGHTIRARDEDAGKAVRCSYCGREALVTQTARDELDMLFDEVERTGVYDPQATKVGKQLHRARERGQHRASAAGQAGPRFDPFAVALKMTYVAVIIIAAVAVYKLAVPYVKDVLARQDRAVVPSPPPDELAGDAAPAASSDQQLGLIAVRLPDQQDGAYVSSVPTRADIFHLPEFGIAESLLKNPVANKNMQTDSAVRLPPGPHTIAVALRLDNQRLMEDPEYRVLRGKLELDFGDTAGNVALLREYFLPDACSSFRVEMGMRDVPYLVRVYEITVYAMTWEPVTALFLPRVPPERLLDFLPRPECYAFNEDYVETELRFYGIRDDDRTYIKDVLRRIGKTSYNVEKRGYRIFQIDLKDGTLTSRDASM